MGLPGIKYEVFAFLGEWNGLNDNSGAGDGVGLVEGYRIKLYDSSDPAPPLILNPLHEISENTAGTLTFILHRLAKTTVYYRNRGDQSTSHYPTEQYVKPFMYMKQTEIAIFRSELTYVPGSGESQSMRKEIWAGRITSITKDFYGDWSITVEGDLSYLNDVTVNYGRISEKKATPAPATLFKNFVNAYQTAVNKNTVNRPITFTSHLPKLPGQDYPPVTSFPPIDRSIYVGDVSDITQENKIISSTTANLDDGYTVSEGPIWSNLQVLLDRYGGHLEIERTRMPISMYKYKWIKRLSWHISGKNDYDNDIQSYIKGYHEYVENKSQNIAFSENLLDYSEEVNGDDMFTVLIPHGSQSVVTTTDEDGKTKTTTGDNITISSVNNGNPELVNNAMVARYGYIEKIETWSISKPSDLKNVAEAYFKDCRIGAFKITIKAYDLKNLLVQEQSATARERLLKLNTLYLYDSVKIVKTGASSVVDIRDMYLPIQGIRLPLDKFPTDTEFTISNARNRRGILQPGTLQSKQEPEQKKNETKDGNEDPEVITDDPVPSINPWAHENGIDGELPHYPPVYLDHSHAYWKGHRTKITLSPPVQNTEAGVAACQTWHRKITVNVTGMPLHVGDRGSGADPRVGPRSFGNGTNLADYCNENKRNLPGNWYYTTVPGSKECSCLYEPYENSSATSSIPGSSPNWASRSVFKIYSYLPDTFFGYQTPSFNGVSGGFSQTQQQFNSVFYSDDLSDTRAYMRRRTTDHSDEKIKNHFEKAYKRATSGSSFPPTLDLDPYIEADIPQYQNAQGTDADYANIATTTGEWHNFNNDKKTEIPKMVLSENPATITSGGNANTIRDKIYATEVFGGVTIGAILTGNLTGINMQLVRSGGTAAQQSYLYFKMIRSIQGEETKTIGVKSIKYRPLSSDVHADKEYKYAIGTRQLNPDTVAVYYLLFEVPKGLDENGLGTAHRTEIENIRIKYGFKKFDPFKSEYNMNVCIQCNQEGIIVDDPTNAVGAVGYDENSDTQLGNTHYTIDSSGIYREATASEQGAHPSILGAWVANWLSSKQQGSDYPNQNQCREWIKSIFQFGTESGVIRNGPWLALKNALTEAANVSSQDEIVNQAEYEARMSFAEAYYSTPPFMIISKCTDIGTGTDEYYGVTFFEETANDGMSLTTPESYEQSTFGYKLSGVTALCDVGDTTKGKPYLICADTLATDNYLFGMHNNNLEVTNPNAVPMPRGNNAPLMILGKCGGRHTARVANGLYMMLSGNRYSTHVEVSEAVSPISGTKEYGAPGTRDLVKEDTSTSTHKVWYHGPDMIDDDDAKGDGRNEWIAVTASIENAGYFRTDPEELKKFYYNSAHLQPLVLGADKYLKITPTLFARMYEASETEGEN